MKTLIQDLLTEDRFWTFWSSDWSKKICVRWNGKTKFSTIVDKMEKKLGEGMKWERQVQIREPEYTFNYPPFSLRAGERLEK